MKLRKAKKTEPQVLMGESRVTGKRVMLAIPTMDNRINATLAQMMNSWAIMGIMGTSPHLIWTAPFIGLSPVEYARNQIVKRFLEHKECDTLLMIDDDMVPNMDTIHVLDHDADITVAPAPMFSKAGGEGSLCYNLFVKNGDEFVIWGPGQEPYCGGTGCVAISRKLLEDPRMVVGDNPWEVFRTLRSKGGESLLSEDLDFMDRAIKLGYKCHTAWEAKLDHFKPCALKYYADAVIRDHAKASPAYLELLEKAKELGYSEQ